MEAETLKILVIDADPECLSTVAQAMRGLETMMWTAVTAASAMNVLHQEFPHLIILDPNLPDVNGFELLKGIREEFSREEMPIMVVAKDPTEDTAIRAIREQANDYLAKPLLLPLLEERIHTTIAAYRKHHKLLERERIDAILSNLDETIGTLVASLSTALEEMEPLVLNDAGIPAGANAQIHAAYQQVQEARNIVQMMPFNEEKDSSAVYIP